MSRIEKYFFSLPNKIPFEILKISTGLIINHCTLFELFFFFGEEAITNLFILPSFFLNGTFVHKWPTAYNSQFSLRIHNVICACSLALKNNEVFTRNP